MADALCGPSNALQSFRKHTSVDHSLQQDRLGPRHLPSQNFRSSPSSASHNLDAEFQAFQAGAPFGDVKSPFDHTHLPQYAQQRQPQLPSWASDFQRMNINDTRMPPSSAAHVHCDPALQHSWSGGGWQQEFIRQPQHQRILDPPSSSAYAPTSSSLAMQQHHHPAFQANTQFMSAQPFTQAPQEMQDAHEAFDEAAFARAFDAAQQDAEQTSSKGKERAQEYVPESFSMDHACTDPGDVLGDFDFDNFMAEQTSTGRITDELLAMKRDGGWEALNAYERALDKEFQDTQSQQSRDIVEAIRTMRAHESDMQQSSIESQKPIGADTITADEPRQDMGSEAEADELSRTAGQLLDNLKDEQSVKFQQSNFMELMRQLRDKEVKVEGDKMVSQAAHPGGQYYPYDAFPGGNDKVSGPPQESEYTQVGA